MVSYLLKIQRREIQIVEEQDKMRKQFTVDWKIVGQSELNIVYTEG